MREDVSRSCKVCVTALPCEFCVDITRRKNEREDMLVKSRALAAAVAVAGLIGFGAPMASAAVVSGPGDNGGLVNVSHNQVPIQGCSNQVGVGVAGGGVPVDGAAIAAALLGVV